MKKRNILFCFLLFSLLAFNILGVTAEVAVEGLGDLEENIEDLEEKAEEIENLPENIETKWDYLGNEWKNVLLKNKLVSGLDSFFTQISVIFEVLGNPPVFYGGHWQLFGNNLIIHEVPSIGGLIFKEVGHSKNRFWWTDTKIRMKRSAVQANSKNGITENQAAEMNKVARIYGCPNRIMVLDCA